MPEAPGNVQEGEQDLQKLEAPEPDVQGLRESYPNPSLPSAGTSRQGCRRAGRGQAGCSRALGGLLPGSSRA